jgi:hypothetical protein
MSKKYKLNSKYKYTLKDFEKASECIVDQYSKYSINGDYLNGRQTLGVLLKIYF